MVGGEMMNAIIIFFCTLVICLTGCQTRHICPKERSYLTAIEILQINDEEEIIDKIRVCDDVDVLRIIAFTASVTAWPMEAGPNVDFDNAMDDICIVAIQRLFEIDSHEADESIEYYKRAFPPDGAYSLFFKDCEEKRGTLRSERNSKAKESKSATSESHKP